MNFKGRLATSGSFRANVLTLMTGTAIAQAIPIAVAPILTRLYTPDNFGIFALYMSVSSLVAVIATGRYELAVLLPDNDGEAINIVALCIIISFLVSLVTFFLVLFFNGPISRLLGISEMANWLFFVPLTILLTSIYQTLNCWSNRKMHFKRLALNRMSLSTVTAGTNLGMGIASFGASGLIVGSIIGQTIPTAVLGWQVLREDNDNINLITSYTLKHQAARYMAFPLFTLPADFLRIASDQIPIFSLSSLFGFSAIGFYSLTQRILSAPITLIAASIQEIFKQRASSDFVAYGNCRYIYVKTFKHLLFLSSFPFGLFLFTAPSLFEVLFGVQWRVAGEYAQILSVMYFFRFIAAPLSYTFYLAGKQKEDLFLRIFICCTTVISLFVGYYVFNNVKYALAFFSLSCSAIYIAYLILSYNYAISPDRGAGITESHTRSQ